VLTLSATASAAPDIDKEDYRLFCGYQDALENPKIKKLKAKRKDKAIARMAKTSKKKLMASVEKVRAVGSTCDEVGKVLSDSTSNEAVITRTIALRAVNPRAKDTTADDAVWWEAKTSPLRAARIDRSRIKDFADTRYKRLFDGIVEK